jgi:transglutaminase/protease-like cytokinesis protein 3
LKYDSVSNVVQTDIYGAYIDGHAVCFEYALLFQYLAKMSGLESYQVSTNIAIPLDADTNVQNHVWNIIKIDNKYYQLDITWADDLNPSDYSFINISDEKMQRLHRYTLPINKVDLYPTTEDMPTNTQEKYYNQ